MVGARMVPASSESRVSAQRTVGSRASALAAVQQGVITCELCPRLRAHCQRIAREKKAAHRAETYWGRPVPGFGDPEARLLIVGLAPAAHGANRTGRVFTGDGSGDFLMRALHDNGFASIPTARDAQDGLVLRDAYILSVVRCAPPETRSHAVAFTCAPNCPRCPGSGSWWRWDVSRGTAPSPLAASGTRTRSWRERGGQPGQPGLSVRPPGLGSHTEHWWLPVSRARPSCSAPITPAARTPTPGA